MSAGPSIAGGDVFNKVTHDVEHVGESSPSIDEGEDDVEEEVSGDTINSRKKKLEELRKRMVRIGLHSRYRCWLDPTLTSNLSRDRPPKRTVLPSSRRAQKPKSRRERRHG